MGEDLFYAVLVGVSLGFIFDLLRLPRIIFNDRFFLDFFFWIISSIFVFCYFLIFNDGTIRMINFIFIFIGFIFYTFTLGYLTKNVEIRVAKKIKIWLKKVKNVLKTFKKVLQSLYNLYYNITTQVKSLFRKKSKGDGYDKENKEK